MDDAVESYSHAYSLMKEEKYKEAVEQFQRSSELFKIRGDHGNAVLSYGYGQICKLKRQIERFDATEFNASAFSSIVRPMESYVESVSPSKRFKVSALEAIYAKFLVPLQEANYGEFAGDLFYKMMKQRRQTAWLDLTSRSKKGFVKRLFLFGRLVKLCLLEVSCGYGERGRRWLAWAVVTPLVFAIFYRSTSCIRISTSIVGTDSFMDCLYFSFVCFTTLGFGDFLPVESGFARLLVVSEAGTGYIMLGLLASIFLRKMVRR